MPSSWRLGSQNWAIFLEKLVDYDIHVSEGNESLPDNGINSSLRSTDSNKIIDISILPGSRKNSSICIQNEQGLQMEETTILPGAISHL